ncbi:GNAT family N-acetyltransferase [Lacticaseibacillus nasuensis]|nr:GNAT family N-acetyltransferase [Lacticaseibacillus nasuensis]
MQVTYQPVSSMQQRNEALAVYRGSLDYFRETAQPLPTKATVHDDQAQVVAGGASRPNHYDLLIVGGKPIGVVSVVPSVPTAETITLRLLLVIRQARDRGYGQAVIAHLRQRYGHQQWHWLQVQVINAEPARLAFWQQEGFTIVSDQLVAMASGDWRQETILRLALDRD